MLYRFRGMCTDYDIKIVFAVLDDRILAAGEETLKGIVGNEDYDT